MKGLILVTLLFSPPTFAEILSYCHDEDADHGWAQLRAKYADTFQSRDVEYLYGLRVDICRQVESGALGLEEASRRFEAERQRIIEEWTLREIEKLEGAGSGAG